MSFTAADIYLAHIVEYPYRFPFPLNSNCKLEEIRNESLFHNIVYAKVEVQCSTNVFVASISFAPTIYYDAKSGVDKERTTPSTFRG